MISEKALKNIFRIIFRDITTLGSLFFYSVLFLFLLFNGFYKFSFLMLIGIIFIYFVVYTIRMLYFKERPRKQHHSTFLEKLDASSFPSIHAARSGFLFSVFGIFFNSIAAWIILSLLCLLVLYSRYYLKKHHFVDLVGGSIIGFFISIVLIIIIL